MPILKNARYEHFALAIAHGESAHTAYTLAGYKQHRQNAARLMTNDDIKARVKEVQLAATLDTMLTIRQKREYLARIVRARVSELADDSDLWQVTITEDGGHAEAARQAARHRSGQRALWRRGTGKPRRCDGGRENRRSGQ